MINTEFKGYVGEFIAILLLKIKGYKILARRYKTVCGEIDVIAKKRDTVAFVEVKFRKSIDECYSAISSKQLKRIQNASQIFLSRNKNLQQNFMRYDVMLVASMKFPVHIINVSIS